MKKCLNCPKDVPDTVNGRKLAKKAYAKKKYCCRKCANEYRKANGVGWFGDGFTTDVRKL